MKVNEDLSILFWLWRQKASKDGMAPIYVRITVKGDRDGFSSGKKIHPDFWDEETATAIRTCPDSKFINSYITKTKAELERHYNQLAAVHDKITAGMVKDAYMPKEVPKKTLMQAFQLHNNEFAERVSKNKGSTGTLARYERLKDKVEAFLKKKYKVADTPLDDIEMALAINFFHYLTMENIGDNTAMKYVKTLKQIIDRAIGEGWIKHNAISGFKCTYVDPDRETLEQHEILAMYNKELPVKRLAEVRDVYIFCCFTGYAYETVYNLEPENIFKGLDGKPWITRDRQKTGVEETVPLLPVALEIIEKYKTHPYCLAENKLLPVNSNFRYNAYLKELATICGIKKNLTTHTARHTFATAVTLENDVPIETVREILGHNDLRSTQKYAKITKRKISNNMKSLEGKLFNADGLLQVSY
ncbi:Site-specific recombinase XerD [Mucilaginibacter mallensis]|uniref:Site-specific recombinase XerD n=1 Tax=Mucilaginibacter mallensis TaxID=652787 RepID=A0A1H1Q0J9_MUCMA|nr:site-specific integrase [Mucilaginibacter mallensis]SDS16479.1 Site-specific recombinase XerD [Mucilaginibacter mallensis]